MLLLAVPFAALIGLATTLAAVGLTALLALVVGLPLLLAAALALVVALALLLLAALALVVALVLLPLAAFTLGVVALTLGVLIALVGHLMSSFLPLLKLELFGALLSSRVGLSLSGNTLPGIVVVGSCFSMERQAAP